MFAADQHPTLVGNDQEVGVAACVHLALEPVLLVLRDFVVGPKQPCRAAHGLLGRLLFDPALHVVGTVVDVGHADHHHVLDPVEAVFALRQIGLQDFVV